MKRCAAAELVKPIASTPAGPAATRAHALLHGVHVLQHAQRLGLEQLGPRR
jgi:hypothetical protein